MTTNTYMVGNTLRLTGTFTDLTGTPTDPDSVVLKVRGPLATVLTLTVAKEAVGTYYGDYTPTEHGRHTYRFEGAFSGSVRAAAERPLQILPSMVSTS